MRSAIVEAGVVVNVIVGEVDGSVPCPEEVGRGWAYEGGAFSPPPVVPEPLPPIEEVKAFAVGETLAHADQLGALFIAGYPESERLSWPQKQAEARLIDGGETDPAAFPIIAFEAAMTGAAPAEIAGWILARAVVFEKAAGIISGFRQVALAGIEAAGDAEGVATALDAAKAAAALKLEQLG